MGFGRRAALAAIGMAAAGTARAQAWPERPVRILVPFAAGGNTDSLARVTAEILGEAIPGSSFIVENRTGAGGLIALEALVRAAPDGHTIMMASVSTVSVSPAAAVQPPRFDVLTDIQPIVNIGTNPFVLMTHRSVPATDLAQCLAWMRANSGRFAFASGGVGAMGHLSMELLLRALNVTAQHVPYRGGAPAIADVIAGNVPVLFANLSEALPHQQNAAVRLHGVSSARRHAQLPNVPAIAEALPGFEMITWNGLIGPAAMPRGVAERIHGIVAAAMPRPAVQARFVALGNDTSGEGPDAFRARIAADVARWREVVRAIGLRAE
jgi:tripartite-type tricarboxylate transporter receptor subunit TctC